ncbi:hypothetical protein KCG48_05110 [Proteiniclasticum sp. BAD-10]|uniref:Uncharacterized protein n=1 Tax=Proteiniclasticum sediminis TaxID=2804028 RepID=A0A941CN34_9CLOT|nr:hypothetical protein [Proteiniclasticum sediminis]MBR0575720.1 hypothetical protein [Proteiniclasticum sediminis]
MNEYLTLPIGTKIKATGKCNGFPVIAGKIVGKHNDVYYIVEGADKVRYYVQPAYFEIEEV